MGACFRSPFRSHTFCLFLCFYLIKEIELRIKTKLPNSLRMRIGELCCLSFGVRCLCRLNSSISEPVLFLFWQLLPQIALSQILVSVCLVACRQFHSSALGGCACVERQSPSLAYLLFCML